MQQPNQRTEGDRIRQQRSRSLAGRVYFSTGEALSPVGVRETVGRGARPRFPREEEEEESDHSGLDSEEGELEVGEYGVDPGPLDPDGLWGEDEPDLSEMNQQGIASETGGERTAMGLRRLQLQNRNRIRSTIGELGEVLGLAESLEATQLAGLLAEQERTLLEGVLRLSRVHAELLAIQLDSLAVELVAMEAEEEPVGLSAEEIQALPLETCGEDVSKAGATCVICQDNFCAGQPVRVLPACSHCFHQSCVDRWLALRPHCPMCRHDYSSSKDKEGDAGSEAEPARSFRPPEPASRRRPV